MRYTTLHARKKLFMDYNTKANKNKTEKWLDILTRVLISCSARVTLIKKNIKENQKI